MQLVNNPGFCSLVLDKAIVLSERGTERGKPYTCIAYGELQSKMKDKTVQNLEHSKGITNKNAETVTNSKWSKEKFAVIAYRL